MRHKKSILCIVFLFSLGLQGLIAQESVNSTGGNAIGVEGSISYSIGQVFTEYQTGEANGSLNQGVQQPISLNSFLTGTAPWVSSCGSRSMSIEFYTPGSGLLQNLYTTTISPLGTFSISDTPEGTFDIYIKIEGYLQSEYLNVAMTGGENYILMDNPIPGDLNGDNGVNIVDISILIIAFGSISGSSDYNYLADLNCDGGVNIVDMSILIISFGMIGDQP